MKERREWGKRPIENSRHLRVVFTEDLFKRGEGTEEELFSLIVKRMWRSERVDIEKGGIERERRVGGREERGAEG